jgi:Ca-activated chloride channel homolog
MAPAPDRLRADHPAGALEPGLRRVRASRVRALQARPHNPDFSTSGLEAVVAEYYAATGKKEGLTEQDVESSKARAIVRDFERSIVHYGDTTLFIADQMRKEGPGYASAVAMEEVTLLDFNRNRGPQPKLVALYPPEGTFYSDNPFIILDGDWVRPAQRQGAERFQEFLAEEITPELAARSGLRPADLEEEAVAPVSKENGADPAQPERVLGLPEPRTLDRIRRAWREDRKPANVLLVVDTSGSMAEENRLVRAKQGLEAFFAEVGKQDSVGLNIFSDRLQSLIPVTPFRQNERQMRQTVENLIADGGTAVYDATIEGFESVRADATPERINAVVVLTDGEDTDSAASAEDAVRAVRGQGDSDDQVRVFTIAYSAGAVGAAEALAQIAEASGGQAYEGDTEDIEAVYRSISSFF